MECRDTIIGIPYHMRFTVAFLLYLPIEPSVRNLVLRWCLSVIAYGNEEHLRYLHSRKTRYRRAAIPYRIKTSDLSAPGCRLRIDIGHSIRRRQALLDVLTCGQPADAGNATKGNVWAPCSVMG